MNCIGDWVITQKTFTADFLTGRRAKNIGQLDSYLVENAHEPIIGREIFELVQKMKGNNKGKSDKFHPYSETTG